MPADVIAVLVESCVRASVVLCAAWALTSALRRASAATRHFVWSCAIAGSILASVVNSVGPRWSVPVPFAFASTESATPLHAPSDVAPAVDAPPIATPVETTGTVASTPSIPVAMAGLDATFWMVLLWTVGAFCVLAYAVSGSIGVWWIRRSAKRLEAPWVEDAHALAEAFEIRGAIDIVQSKAVTMPLVCGVWHPLIVMPESAAEWSDERRHVVVLHEIAHIKRRDCLTQAVAQALCAAYWFNPIVWLAARRLRAERERACDDFVLAAGQKGSDYAAHLLDIARSMGPRRVPEVVGLAMARPSQLEGRLLAILDPAIRRSSALHTRLAALAFVLFVTLPVGAVKLTGPEPASSVLEAGATDEATLPTAASSQLSATPRPTPTPRPEPVPMPRPSPEPRDQATFGNAIELDPDQIGAEIGHALGAQIGQQIAAAALGQAGAAADPKTVEALIAALSDADPDVREIVVVTLGRMRDPRVVPALLPLLKDSNADVREQAVFALARTGDSRATAAVATMIDDASPDVREQAVHLLGQSRNRDAVPLLLKALQDPAADVREQAAFGLGQLRDASAVDPLVEALKDSSPDVREQAVFALGQLRNPSAIDGLMAALKDSNAEVREQAAFALGHLRDPKALPSLTAALRDEAADVREQAAFAIGQISGQQ